MKYKFVILFVFILLYMFNLLSLQDDFAKDYRVIFFGIPSLFIVATMANMKMPKMSLQLVGGYSYSLYLIHFPLLSLCFKIFTLDYFNSFSAWFLVVIAVASCNGFAFIIWKYIEEPLTRNLRRKFVNQLS